MREHGGDVYQASAETGIPVGDIVDFSASINPLGVPEPAARAIRENIGLLVHYPDPFADGFSRTMAEHLGVAPKAVICGNGSTELIYLLARVFRPQHVLVLAPTFSEYERACLMTHGSSCVRHVLSPRDGYALDPVSFIDSLAGCDMAFLCNPNNPTGRLLEREAVLEIARAANRGNCLLVLDEAFIDFTPDQSLVRGVEKNPNLIVLRSLTKFYALSGLRIGYGVFPDALARRIRGHKEPWSVNTLAQKAAAAAIGDAAYRERTMALIPGEKDFLEKGFRAIGIEYVPSSANYYLLRMEQGLGIVPALRKKGILVRDCSNFAGLDGSCIRVAVRSRQENSRLLAELGELCAL